MCVATIVASISLNILLSKGLTQPFSFEAPTAKIVCALKV
jgi:hypothetical protein